MIDEQWYRRPDGVPEAVSAGGVVVRVEDGQVMVALIREQSYEEYVLPKGHVDKGESVEEAARREIEEEAGFTELELIRPMGVRERMNYRRTEWKTTHYFLYRTEQVDVVPTDFENHEVVDWFPIDRLPVMMWPEQKALLGENEHGIVAAVSGQSDP